jgi:ABC-2 type transport system permease protein
MRKIWYLGWNEIRIYFSERSSVVFFLVLPIVFTAILGASLADDGAGADDRYSLLVVDADDSALSAELRSALESSDIVQPTFESQVEAAQLLEEEAAPALLTIPAGFGATLLAAGQAGVQLRTLPNDNRVFAIQQAVNAATGRVGNAVGAARASVAEAERIRPFESAAARQAYFDAALALARDVLGSSPARVETTQAVRANTQLADGFEQASPGQLVTWVLVTLLGASVVFVYERRRGTLQRLMTTPTRQVTVFAGKIVGWWCMGLVQMTLLIVVGARVFGVNWGRSPAALALLVVVFAFTAVALGVALAAFARTPQQANGLTIVLSMLMAALGGAWWPLEITPPTYQTVVKALPSTWAMLGFADVILRGQGVAGVLPEAGVLLAFAAVFFAVGLWRLRA